MIYNTISVKYFYFETTSNIYKLKGNIAKNIDILPLSGAILSISDFSWNH